MVIKGTVLLLRWEWNSVDERAALVMDSYHPISPPVIGLQFAHQASRRVERGPQEI